MELKYPEVAGFKAEDTETSRGAANKIESHAKTLREKCLSALKGAEMTADETAELLGESILSIRPRISELKAQGKIEATTKRRCNVSGSKAVVWRACGKLVQPNLI